MAAEGFRRKRKQFELTFEGDSELDGLVVVMEAMPLGEYMEMTGLDGSGDGWEIGDMLRRFAKALISWNLQEEDGTPVPATEAAVLAEDSDQMLTVASEWVKAIKGVRESDPLPDSSPDGGPSLEASIPMDAPSQSLAS